MLIFVSTSNKRAAKQRCALRPVELGRERLEARGDLELILLGERRRDVEARREALNAADAVILCLPDEAAREAHKSAWYWGGTAGMAVGGVAMVLSRLPQAASIRIPTLGDPTPAGYAATGAMMMLCLMLLGYTLAWAWWWLARR